MHDPPSLLFPALPFLFLLFLHLLSLFLFTTPTNPPLHNSSETLPLLPYFRPSARPPARPPAAFGPRRSKVLYSQLHHNHFPHCSLFLNSFHPQRSSGILRKKQGKYLSGSGLFDYVTFSRPRILKVTLDTCQPLLLLTVHALLPITTPPIVLSLLSLSLY